MAKSKAPTTDVFVLGSEAAPLRLSFPELATPKKFDDAQAPRYKAAFLYDKSNAAHKAELAKLKAAMLKLIADAGYKNPKEFKLCIADGDSKTYDGYAGCYYLSASNDAKHRPGIKNRRNMTVSEGEAGFPYAGCYVRAKVTFWLQDNKFGKRINANLIAVQFVKDGDAFGAGEMDDEFEALGDDAGSGGTDTTDDDIDF